MPSSSGIATLLLIIAAAAIMYFTKLGCVWQRLLGFPCPACGLTRATVYLFEFNFAKAFAMHPMVFSLPLIAVYILYDGRPFKNRAVNIGIISVLGAGFLATWLWHIFVPLS